MREQRDLLVEIKGILERILVIISEEEEEEEESSEIELREVPSEEHIASVENPLDVDREELEEEEEEEDWWGPRPLYWRGSSS